jgi:ATPase family associated with various cellular activities (AAA)
MTAVERQPPISFQPALRAGDPLAEHWLRNITLRLRRELCWLWRERAPESTGSGNGALPPFTDRLGSVLDLARYAADKAHFFKTDETAAFLTGLIEKPAPADIHRRPPERGSFAWIVRELELAEVDSFVLALALGPAIDSAAGAVYAACLNDPARTAPSLALAQRLWDDPAALFALASPAHPLFTHGLLAPPTPGATVAWEAPLAVPPMIAGAVFSPSALPSSLQPVAAEKCGSLAEGAVAAARVKTDARTRLRIAPVLGPRGAPLSGFAAAIAEMAGRKLAAPAQPAIGNPGNDSQFSQLLTLAWLHGVDFYAGFDALGDSHATAPVLPPLAALPITLFVGMHERHLLGKLPPAIMLPPIHVPALGYRERVELWSEQLPTARRDPELAAAIADCARRFRYEKQTILELARDLLALGRPIKPADLTAACRADLDLGDLAQPVEPRFRIDELMLPQKQARQLREILHAMRSLTLVHYEWGTARVWNEGGLSALFAGPPGTGKTMAAEVIAAELGLPLFRIDLSQVVNKYIGETEKNLRRLFDAAEASDVILFFDEADSLFGKRTEVKDAHDRYANLEVSYLLERMERFKGLAILATNRKKDLDDAFLRRLRFLIDFPLPGVEERLRIWKSAVPEGVDASALDSTFLANRFPLAGGHIRSIVFHACLQSAAPGAPRELSMPAVIAAVKREYDKLDRALSLEQCGQYAAIAEKLQ